MMRIISSTATLLAALVITMVNAPAHAESVCIAITAEVEFVDDSTGVLAGAVNVGDVITGTYVYESTTPDTNSAPTVGDYRHTTAPFGITLNAGGFVFRTDPNNFQFLVEIINDNEIPPIDHYLLVSTDAIFDIEIPSEPPYETVNYIFWQLDDPTATALSSDALPTVPPVLADWQSSGLDLYSSGSVDSFNIRSHVTSANLCSETPPNKVAICHKPGTPAEKTLLVARSAVRGHLGHGDALGKCP